MNTISNHFPDSFFSSNKFYLEKTLKLTKTTKTKQNKTTKKAFQPLPLPIFPLEFQGAVPHEETRVMGILCGEECVILS